VCATLQLRAKEEQRARRHMYGLSKEQEQHIGRVQRAPRVASIIHSLFTVHANPVIPKEQVIESIQHSYSYEAKIPHGMGACGCGTVMTTTWLQPCRVARCQKPIN
jgi:hypothetical protein